MMPDFLTAMLGGGAKPTPNTMSPMNPKGIDTKADGIAQSVAGMFAGNYGMDKLGGMFGSAPTNSQSGGPTSRGGMRNHADGTVAMPQEGMVTNGVPANNATDWTGTGKAILHGIGSSMGGGKEEAPQASAPPITGGQYFTMPKGNMSDNRIGGAPKGILAQHKQL